MRWVARARALFHVDPRAAPFQLRVPEVGAPDRIRRVETAEAVMDKADDIGIIGDRPTAIAAIGTINAVE